MVMSLRVLVLDHSYPSPRITWVSPDRGYGARALRHCVGRRFDLVSRRHRRMGEQSVEPRSPITKFNASGRPQQALLSLVPEVKGMYAKLGDPVAVGVIVLAPQFGRVERCKKVFIGNFQ